MTFTNPIPIWLSTTVRQIRGRYSDRQGGRCALGILMIPKHCTEDGPMSLFLDAFGLKDDGVISDMNDERGLSFSQIAQEVANDPDRYFWPEALVQFRREEAIAREFESMPESVPVVVKEAL